MKPDWSKWFFIFSAVMIVFSSPSYILADDDFEDEELEELEEELEELEDEH